jgi:hypothetical protein
MHKCLAGKTFWGEITWSLKQSWEDNIEINIKQSGKMVHIGLS